MKGGGVVGPRPDPEHGALDAGDAEGVGQPCEEDVEATGVEEVGGLCGKSAWVDSGRRGAEVGVGLGDDILREGDEALSVEM